MKLTYIFKQGSQISSNCDEQYKNYRVQWKHKAESCNSVQGSGKSIPKEGETEV